MTGASMLISDIFPPPTAQSLDKQLPRIEKVREEAT